MLCTSKNLSYLYQLELVTKSKGQMHFGQQEQKTNVHFFASHTRSLTLCKYCDAIYIASDCGLHKFHAQFYLLTLSLYDLGSYGSHAAYCM